MPRVVCTLRNASHLINGVRFASLGDDGGMLSEELSEQDAAGFLAIPGYQPYVPLADVPQHHEPTADDKANAKKPAAAKKESV